MMINMYVTIATKH